jgi:tRNA pseudouridine38-40 synthase
MAIGGGDRPIDWAAQVLAQRDRTQGGVTAPPDGLYLERVWYPEDYLIPAPPPVPLIPAESGL